MIHDPDLLDKLAEFKAERFEGRVFRGTRSNLDPTTVGEPEQVDWQSWCKNNDRWTPETAPEDDE